MLVDIFTPSVKFAQIILSEYPDKSIKEHFGENKLEQGTLYGFFGLDAARSSEFLRNNSANNYILSRHEDRSLILSNSGDLAENDLPK